MLTSFMYGPGQANLVVTTYASSEGSGDPAPRQNLSCSLKQAMSQEEPSDRKPDPWPLWMTGHEQLKFFMTRNARRHKFAWRGPYSCASVNNNKKCCWLCWGLTSQSTIFQSYRDGAIASWVINQYFRGVKCLAQGHNTAAVGLEPRTSRSGVRHSTTEPPRSPNKKCAIGRSENERKSVLWGKMFIFVVAYMNMINDVGNLT